MHARSHVRRRRLACGSVRLRSARQCGACELRATQLRRTHAACRERHTVAQVRRGERPFIRALPDVQPELRPYCAVRPNNLPPATRTPTRTPLEGTHGCTHARTQAICSRTWMRDSRFRCQGGSGLRYGGHVTSRTDGAGGTLMRLCGGGPTQTTHALPAMARARTSCRRLVLPAGAATIVRRRHVLLVAVRCAVCRLSSRSRSQCGDALTDAVDYMIRPLWRRPPAWWIRCMRRTCSRTSHSRSSISASSLGTGAASRRAAVTAWKVH